VTWWRARSRAGDEGFTIVELVIAMGLLAIISASMAGVFYGAIRTAGAAAHRTDAASIAGREIESMRAVGYGSVGFYQDQTSYPGNGSQQWTDPADGNKYAVVTLGATTPAGAPSQIQPVSPDPNAASAFVPDPNPANANPIVQGGVSYTVQRYVVWVDAKDAVTSYDLAYKRLTVIVSWTDQVGPHQVRQDSLLYPGGQGKYQGPKGVAGSTTTTTTTPAAPAAPVLAPIPAPTVAGQLVLTWAAGTGGAPVTSQTIEYATDVNFTTVTPINNQSPTETTYTLSGLAASTTYFVRIVAYAGTSAASNVQSQTTLAPPAPCTLGPLSVTGQTSLSTTGTILAAGNKMSENLLLTWSTTGASSPCGHTFEVRAFDTTNAEDPGSPYVLVNNNGSYTGMVSSFGQKGWATGLHTFKVYDFPLQSYTTVVKTFSVCVAGKKSCP
jgi:type II secretory pathway pseudopilin PulG